MILYEIGSKAPLFDAVCVLSLIKIALPNNALSFYMIVEFTAIPCNRVQNNSLSFHSSSSSTYSFELCKIIRNHTKSHFIFGQAIYIFIYRAAQYEYFMILVTPDVCRHGFISTKFGHRAVLITALSMQLRKVIDCLHSHLPRSIHNLNAYNKYAKV